MSSMLLILPALKASNIIATSLTPAVPHREGKGAGVVRQRPRPSPGRPERRAQATAGPAHARPPPRAPRLTVHVLQLCGLVSDRHHGAHQHGQVAPKLRNRGNDVHRRNRRVDVGHERGGLRAVRGAGRGDRRRNLGLERRDAGGHVAHAVERGVQPGSGAGRGAKQARVGVSQVGAGPKRCSSPPRAARAARRGRLTCSGMWSPSCGRGQRAPPT
jgi:hypothetical protein